MKKKNPYKTQSVSENKNNELWHDDDGKEE